MNFNGELNASKRSLQISKHIKKFYYNFFKKICSVLIKHQYLYNVQVIYWLENFDSVDQPFNNL